MEKPSHTWLAICSLVAFLLPLGIRLWPLAAGALGGGGGPVPAASSGSLAVATPPRAESVTESLTEAVSGASEVRHVAWLDDEPAAGAAGEADETYTPLAEFQDVQRLLWRLFLATSAVLGLCILLLQFGGRWWRAAPGAVGPRQLQVTESLVISRDAGIKLLQLGEQRLLVGHDRSGIRSMLLVPASFGELLGDAARPEQVVREREEEGGVELRGLTARRSASSRPEETGWDLTRPMS